MQNNCKSKYTLMQVFSFSHNNPSAMEEKFRKEVGSSNKVPV